MGTNRYVVSAVEITLFVVVKFLHLSSDIS